MQYNEVRLFTYQLKLLINLCRNAPNALIVITH